jgi:Fur family transcriptional regulator, ferric uptake regulator
MKNAKVVFKEYLNSRGLKFTPERKVILETVLSMKSHFDMEQLQEHIRKEGARISSATVYRSKPHLIKSGLVREVLRCENRPQYELDIGHPHHDHLICLNCGQVFEFRDESIEHLQDKICEQFQFKPVEHRLGIRGYCKRCLKKTRQ